jgi:hypothetical protein
MDVRCRSRRWVVWSTEFKEGRSEGRVLDLMECCD